MDFRNKCVKDNVEFLRTKRLPLPQQKFIGCFDVEGEEVVFTKRLPRLIHKGTPEERLIFYPVKLTATQMSQQEFNKLARIAQKHGKK